MPECDIVLVPLLPLDDCLWAHGDSFPLLIIGYIITGIAFVLTELMTVLNKMDSVCAVF